MSQESRLHDTDKLIQELLTEFPELQKEELQEYIMVLHNKKNDTPLRAEFKQELFRNLKAVYKQAHENNKSNLSSKSFTSKLSSWFNNFSVPQYGAALGALTLIVVIYQGVNGFDMWSNPLYTSRPTKTYDYSDSPETQEALEFIENTSVYPKSDISEEGSTNKESNKNQEPDESEGPITPNASTSNTKDTSDTIKNLPQTLSAPSPEEKVNIPTVDTPATKIQPHVNNEETTNTERTPSLLLKPSNEINEDDSKTLNDSISTADDSRLKSTDEEQYKFFHSRASNPSEIKTQAVDEAPSSESASYSTQSIPQDEAQKSIQESIEANPETLPSSTPLSNDQLQITNDNQTYTRDFSGTQGSTEQALPTDPFTPSIPPQEKLSFDSFNGEPETTWTYEEQNIQQQLYVSLEKVQESLKSHKLEIHRLNTQYNQQRFFRFVSNNSTNSILPGKNYSNIAVELEGKTYHIDISSERNWFRIEKTSDDTQEIPSTNFSGTATAFLSSFSIDTSSYGSAIITKDWINQQNSYVQRGVNNQVVKLIYPLKNQNLRVFNQQHLIEGLVVEINSKSGEVQTVYGPLHSRFFLEHPVSIPSEETLKTLFAQQGVLLHNEITESRNSITAKSLESIYQIQKNDSIWLLIPALRISFSSDLHEPVIIPLSE